MEVISWISAHVGQNCELCLSAHRRLPGTLRYLLKLVVHSVWRVFADIPVGSWRANLSIDSMSTPIKTSTVLFLILPPTISMTPWGNSWQSMMPQSQRWSLGPTLHLGSAAMFMYGQTKERVQVETIFKPQLGFASGKIPSLTKISMYLPSKPSGDQICFFALF